MDGIQMRALVCEPPPSYQESGKSGNGRPVFLAPSLRVYSAAPARPLSNNTKEVTIVGDSHESGHGNGKLPACFKEPPTTLSL